MDLDLTFGGGRMSGGGNDDVGQFLIKGQYDAQSLECWWTKSYVGAHDVFYRGFREGKGIWGTWEITVQDHGGFHIWPKRVGEGEMETTAAEEDNSSKTTALCGQGANSMKPPAVSPITPQLDLAWRRFPNLPSHLRSCRKLWLGEFRLCAPCRRLRAWRWTSRAKAARLWLVFCVGTR